MRLRLALCGVVVCLCLVPMVSAQDAVKTDPKHYSVMSENDQVRILKVHYGPHEKSIMHSHPATVAVFLTDAKGQFGFPDGKKGALRRQGRAGAIRSRRNPLAGKYRRRRDGCDRDRTERPCQALGNTCKAKSQARLGGVT